MTDPACGYPGCEAGPARAYIDGRACDAHSPAGRRGATVPIPDPALTAVGLRRSWYEEQGLPYVPPAGTPESSTLIDQRRVAAGKTRSSIGTFRAAQAATRKDHP